MAQAAVVPAPPEQPAAPSSSAAAPPPAPAAAGDSPACSLRSRRSPAAWLRRVLRGAQAVAEDRPGQQGAEGAAEDDDASDAGADDEHCECTGFGSLPEHLLERILSHLRGANRKHHFAVCGVNQQWRRLGRTMFFARPWEVAHLICHPTQLFCLSPRNVTGSRSGLLKCYVRREHGPGGKRFTFHIGKDASQPHRSRFLMAAKAGGRDEVLLYLNSRCQGPPCARLRCNMLATQYKLSLADDLQLEPTGSRDAGDQQRERDAAAATAAAAAAAPKAARVINRLQSWDEEAAAEARRAAMALGAGAVRRGGSAGARPSGADDSSGGGSGGAPPELDCLAVLQYQARVKGFMQPRRMRVVLPSARLLFYDQALPQLSRRASEPLSAASLPGGAHSPPGLSAASLPGSASASMRRSLSAGAASSSASSPEAGPLGAADAGDVAAAASPPAGRAARLLQRLRLRAQRPKLLRQQQTAPEGGALQPVVLQNKAPHWNEGLRCWCLNFRGRVKLASVKNFQLVRAGDPGERVVMQFGKAEADAFILDFNPTVLTAAQAFGCVISTFSSKLFL